jgi:radical SAM protein with 4Fe4S-binding SPASM domain
MSIDSSGINGTFDFCIFFPSTENIGGTIYVQGWLYEKEHGGKPPLIEAEINNNVIASFVCDVERPDVQSVYKDAPSHSGFMAYIPVPDHSCLSAPLSIYYKSRAVRLKIADQSVFNIDNLLESPQLLDALAPRQRRRLQNLILNEKERIHKASLLKSAPLYLIIDPSFACQLQCPYCHGNMVREAGVSLPVMKEDMVDAILAKYGDTLLQAHFFNWGEPLLNNKFSLFVKKAHELDIWTTSSSNFSLNISEESIDSIILSGLDLLIVSVDGTTQETYERYRVGGNLQLVLDNLKTLVERRRILGSRTPEIRFQILDFPWTHDQIEEARAIATDIGVDEFDAKGGCIHPPKKLVNLTAGQNTKKVLMREGYQTNFLRLQKEKKEKYRYFGCDHLYHQLSINSDGSVHPCCYVYEPGHAVGHVLKDDDCFNSEMIQSSRGVFNNIHEGEIYGHDPCVNCWIVGDQEAKGHKESTISFQPAFEMIVKKPLNHFIACERRHLTSGG